MPVGAATVASDAPVQPPPIAGGKSCPTQFRMEYKTLPSSQESSVKTEFRKYTSGEVSSEETDILWFWEVRFFCLEWCYDLVIE